jgi:hypothetical protein
VAVTLVSMPCQELFEAQELEYKLSVFPEGVPVLSVEASCAIGWERYSHLAVGMPNCYGTSGPIKDVRALPPPGLLLSDPTTQPSCVGRARSASKLCSSLSLCPLCLCLGRAATHRRVVQCRQAALTGPLSHPDVVGCTCVV